MNRRFFYQATIKSISCRAHSRHVVLFLQLLHLCLYLFLRHPTPGKSICLFVVSSTFDCFSPHDPITDLERHQRHTFITRSHTLTATGNILEPGREIPWTLTRLWIPRFPEPLAFNGRNPRFLGTIQYILMWYIKKSQIESQIAIFRFNDCWQRVAKGPGDGRTLR